MFGTFGTSPAWGTAEQATHSALWSVFVDIDRVKDAERFSRRYDVDDAESVGRQLLSLLDLKKHSGETPLAPVRTAYTKLALWTLAPRFEFIARRKPATAGALRQAFVDTFGFPPAARRPRADDGNLVPDMPELGIEDAECTVEAHRRRVRGHLTSTIHLPFADLKESIHPPNWGDSPFWTDVVQAKDSAGRWGCGLRLPGGKDPGPEKTRSVLLHCDIAMSAFDARVDYRGCEAAALTHPEVVDGQEAVVDSPEGESGKPERWVEVGDFNGFLAIEKLAGRPFSCRVSLQREVTFLQINHQLRASETLRYWLATDLLALAEAAYERLNPKPLYPLG